MMRPSHVAASWFAEILAAKSGGKLQPAFPTAARILTKFMMRVSSRRKCVSPAPRPRFGLATRHG